MTPWAPLWAAGFVDVIGIVVFILVFVVPFIGQMLNKARQQQQQQQQRGGGRPPGGGARVGGAGGVQAGGAGGAQAGGRGGNVEDDIGEFLRRAAERRGGAAPAPPPPRQQAVDVLVAAEVVDDAPLGGHLREHVGEYLDSSKFDRRASELGDEASQADRATEQRLHQKFDHKLGDLAGRQGESATAPRLVEALDPEDRELDLPPTAAVGVTAMLRDVDNIRQAIIISEILNRPEDRWT
ncbi:MAG: hypothetical protein HQ567_09600 [Candidatus Nealsonbacteria bacterium]|nr:hypothetical protein [Candidatus Nealsonbacteria bacterium]